VTSARVWNFSEKRCATVGQMCCGVLSCTQELGRANNA
jgi:hypothetical protein